MQRAFSKIKPWIIPGSTVTLTFFCYVLFLSRRNDEISLMANAFDGAAHLNYLRIILDGRLPTLADTYVAVHFPLFYLIGAFFVRVFTHFSLTFIDGLKASWIFLILIHLTGMVYWYKSIAILNKHLFSRILLFLLIATNPVFVLMPLNWNADAYIGTVSAIVSYYVLFAMSKGVFSNRDIVKIICVISIGFLVKYTALLMIPVVLVGLAMVYLQMPFSEKSIKIFFIRSLLISVLPLIPNLACSILSGTFMRLFWIFLNGVSFYQGYEKNGAHFVSSFLKFDTTILTNPKALVVGDAVSYKLSALSMTVWSLVNRIRWVETPWSLSDEYKGYFALLGTWGCCLLSGIGFLLLIFKIVRFLKSKQDKNRKDWIFIAVLLTGILCGLGAHFYFTFQLPLHWLGKIEYVSTIIPYFLLLFFKMVDEVQSKIFSIGIYALASSMLVVQIADLIIF